MKKIKCVSIAKDTFENLEQDFHENLKISELQSYFPMAIETIFQSIQ